MADYRKLMPFILKWEGGYSNDKDDLGGATYKGITLATFRSVYGNDKTVRDLKAMTSQQWEHIFKTLFWDAWQADRINDQNVANILVDWAWGSGSYGIKIPQRVLGVAVDGIVGGKTLAAVNARDGKALFKELKEERIAYIGRICRTRPQNRKFRQGWLNRINSLKYE